MISCVVSFCYFTLHWLANLNYLSGGHFAKYWANIGGGGGEIFNMYAFGVGLRYANLSNIMLGISN